MSVLLLLCSESGLLCQFVKGYLPLSLLRSSAWLDLCWGLWSILTWVLCMVIDMVYLQSSTHHHPVVPAPFVEDAFLLPLYTFSCFVKNQVFVGVWINNRIFNLIPLVYLSNFVPIPGCLQDYSSIVELEVRDGDASSKILYCTGLSWLSRIFCFSK